MEKAIIIILGGLIAIGFALLSFATNAGLTFIGAGLIGFAICLKEIPADPPHKGVIVFLGKRIGEVKNEGWRILLPKIYDVILIDVTKKNKDLSPEAVRTPDLALLEIPISITWTPDENNLIEYLNSGGEENVWKILEDIVRERVREWAIDRQEGPQDFEEALGAREEAISILIKAVAGEDIEPIPSSVPTPILLKYFNQPQKPPTENQAKQWGKNWEKVKEILEKEDKEKIRKAIEKRKKQVQEIQRGNGKQPIRSLGIILNRLNIGDIALKPGTELARTAEAKVKEEKEREGEKVEIEHVKNRIEELTKLGFSLQEARDIVQTERGKVEKKIIDIQGIGNLLKGISKGGIK